ncbi:uncharacterized protein LOC111701070 isoform X2 [Eurytemora carolleeae]|uniref:uncharacterized protein LOC111701070 isoform X2 n=1 Tax=Eurytemora carolleeae TaxID=1294199 RepID=UPI000C78D6DF|nr:uncharacterized protein LOC111701070 isoform X2 [Eurytemora carolleeae]|eukprot:XP_023327970.1 uncharacterized protein LOC111701070 isoform X2 [Eurytemora affinis]
MTRILEGVRKLVQHQPEDPTQDLKKRNLRDFLEGFLTSQVFGEMSRNLKARRKLGLAHRPYQDLLCLFNHGLEHLKEVLMDPVLQEVSWPMPEFLRPGSDELPVNWNDALHVDETVQFIDSLKLEDLQVYEADSWRNLVEQIWAYVDRISVPNYDTSVLVSELRRSLSRSYRGYTEQCCRGGGGENITPPPEILPWTDILVCCAQYRLSCMEGSDRIVGYREDKILEYSLPSQWTRDKLRIEEPCYNPDLRDKLKEEQKQSLRLELMLENALSEDYKPNLLRSSFDLEEDQGLEGENNHEGRRSIESVPLISYVSPSLGRIVSPYTVSCRSEMISTGMSPLSRKGKENRRSGEMVRTHRFSGEKRGAESTKKRWSGDLHSSAKRQRGGDKKRFIPDAEYSQGLGGDLQPTPGIAGQLDEFKNTLEDEMIKSDRFEKLLQAALNP